MPMNCTQLLLFIKINLCSQRLCNASLHSIRVKFSAFFSFIGIDAPAFDLWHNSKPLKKYWFCPIFFSYSSSNCVFSPFFSINRKRFLQVFHEIFSRKNEWKKVYQVVKTMTSNLIKWIESKINLYYLFSLIFDFSSFLVFLWQWIENRLDRFVCMTIATKKTQIGIKLMYFLKPFIFHT